MVDTKFTGLPNWPLSWLSFWSHTITMFYLISYLVKNQLFITSYNPSFDPVSSRPIVLPSYCPPVLVSFVVASFVPASFVVASFVIASYLLPSYRPSSYRPSSYRPRALAGCDADEALVCYLTTYLFHWCI